VDSRLHWWPGAAPRATRCSQQGPRRRRRAPKSGQPVYRLEPDALCRSSTPPVAQPGDDPGPPGSFAILAPPRSTTGGSTRSRPLTRPLPDLSRRSARAAAIGDCGPPTEPHATALVGLYPAQQSTIDSALRGRNWPRSTTGPGRTQASHLGVPSRERSPGDFRAQRRLGCDSAPPFGPRREAPGQLSARPRRTFPAAVFQPPWGSGGRRSWLDNGNQFRAGAAAPALDESDAYARSRSTEVQRPRLGDGARPARAIRLRSASFWTPPIQELLEPDRASQVAAGASQRPPDHRHGCLPSFESELRRLGDRVL